MKANKLPTPGRRRKTLLSRRNLKMAASAHAFVRGSTVRFYEWLQAHGRRTVPDGPSVWICGDCHVGNMGPVTDLTGRVSIQIRDFDQTVIGNPNHDLVRLALSLASAARGSNLSGVTTAQMLEQMMAGYLGALTSSEDGTDNESRPECVRVAMKRAVRRTWKHLARERLKDLKPNIPLGRRFWPLSERERRAIRTLFDTEGARQLVTLMKVRDDDSSIEVCDSAYWMKGCSSLGRLRIAALLRVSGKRRDDEYCLLDIKEATAAAAPKSAEALIPRDNGWRVVTGARRISPALGDRMIAARLLDRSVFVRELMPQDLKLDIDQLSQEEAVSAARYLATVVGSSHARQMDQAVRDRFASSLSSQMSKQLDAPTWLWTSVVDLMSIHEAAYLEHCRTYALTTAASS